MEAYPKSARSSSWIYEDLMPEILKRLPVKSLARFRCVCKSWNSLITSPYLMNLRHSFTSSTPPHLKPFLQIPYIRYGDHYYDSYTLCSPPDTTHDIHFPFEFGEETLLNFTNEEAEFDFSFVDVVRGLVCFSSTLDSSYDSTVVWNPAIHKFLRIPHRPLPLHIQTAIADSADADFKHWDGSVRFDSHAIGFGYDTRNNDFKVVRLFLPRIGFLQAASVEPMYEVYSSREGLWRAAIAPIIQPCFLDSSSTRIGCFLNGTIHWVVARSDDRNPYVLMFECGREEFTTVELPKEISPLDSRCFRLELFEYAGMLSAVVNPPEADYSFVDVWAMVDYGLVSSWKKLFRVHTLELHNIDSYQPSLALDKLAPYGPAQWADVLLRSDLRMQQVLSHRVYDETLFLMDDAQAESYAKNEIVSIQLSYAKNEIVSIQV